MIRRANCIQGVPLLPLANKHAQLCRPFTLSLLLFKLTARRAPTAAQAVKLCKGLRVIKSPHVTSAYIVVQTCYASSELTRSTIK